MRARLIAIFLLLPLISHAAPKKTKEPVPAVPAIQAQPATSPQPSEPLTHSDLNGRDLLFITQAIDLGKALRYLAEKAPQSSDTTLRGFGDELVKTLAAQSAVLTTVAEMREITIPEREGETEKQITERCSKLDGVRLDKALLDSFLDIDRKALATYELGVTSKDATIQKLAEQTLPRIREHLLVVEAMAGIAPDRTGGAAAPVARNATRPEPVPPPLTEPATPQVVTESPFPMAPRPAPLTAPPSRPGFRTNVRLPGNAAPTTGQ